jgi:acyl-coenzyme A synthetase/AMP-(fatty) acid ligase
VPVNPALKGSSLEHVLHNAGAAFAIVHDSVLDRVLAATPPARPRASVEVRLVDENDCSVGVGEVGQLILRTEAPWVMNHGYNNNPQVTADTWRNCWFRAGDAFIRDADGDYWPDKNSHYRSASPDSRSTSSQ